MAPPNNNRRKRPKFSFAYSRFVGDPEKDLLGIVAYALYKRDKVRWVQDQCSINKREPTRPEAIKWSDTNSTPEKVAEYRRSALKTFERIEQSIEARIIPGLRQELIPLIREELPGVNAEKVAAIESSLRTIISQTDSSRSFRANVKAGISASFFYSLGLAGTYLILWSIGFPLPPPPWADSPPSVLRSPTPQAPDKIPPKVGLPR